MPRWHQGGVTHSGVPLCLGALLKTVMSNRVYGIREPLSWTAARMQRQAQQTASGREVDIHTQFMCEWLIGVRVRVCTADQEWQRKVIRYECMCFASLLWMAAPNDKRLRGVARCKWREIWQRKQVFPVKRVEDRYWTLSGQSLYPRPWNGNG